MTNFAISVYIIGGIYRKAREDFFYFFLNSIFIEVNKCKVFNKQRQTLRPN